MSILTHPPIASTVARMLQRATTLNAQRMAARAHARLPEFTCYREDLEFTTTSGPTQAVVYRPPSADPRTPPAVHVNLHGGGYVMALTELDDPACRALAVLSGSVVLNLDYPVAPQHPFPAPPHHVYEAVRWIAENGATHGWDGARLTVGGQSAGGGLAAATARLALERGGPRIALQVLHYPPLDLSVPARAKRSVIDKPMLRPWMGDVFDTCYAPKAGLRKDRLVSPAAATDTADLTGIAPAVVVTAEHDILRDEARRYAERLATVGALIAHHEVPGVDHGYDLEDDEQARQTYTRLADHLRRAVSART